MSRDGAWWLAPLLLVVVGCMASPEPPTTGGSAPPSGPVAEVEGPTATAREALTALTAAVARVAPGAPARLGKVYASKVAADGRARAWTFMYYRDAAGRPGHTEALSFRWNRGAVETGSEVIWSKGLTTPADDYLTRDVGAEWADSPAVAPVAYREPGKLTERGPTLELRWDRRLSEAGPVWTIKDLQPGNAPVDLDGRTLAPLPVR